MYFKVTVANGQYSWQLLKNNGQALAQSPAPYPDVTSIQADINLIKQWAASAPIVLGASNNLAEPPKKKYTIHAVEEHSGARMSLPVEAASVEEIFVDLKDGIHNWLADEGGSENSHWRIVVIGEDGSLAGHSQLTVWETWSGEVPTHCQLCKASIGDTFVDGKIIAPLGPVPGPWGIMCCACHAVHGVGLGEGKGQMYHKQNGEYVLVPARNNKCVIKTP